MKKMIWSFIGSLIIFGIGCGMIFIGIISFDVLENDESTLKKVTKEYDMNEDLIIHPYSDYGIEYVESDDGNVKVEYSINEYCEIDFSKEHTNIIRAWTYCDNPPKLLREFIKNANKKKIVPINNSIAKITVYANQENIDKLKDNWDKYISDTTETDETINAPENTTSDI